MSRSTTKLEPRNQTVKCTHALYLRADNDRNGNPRRAFFGYTGFAMARCKIEGYSGYPEWVSGIPCITVNVQPAELKRWIQECERLGLNVERG